MQQQQAATLQWQQATGLQVALVWMISAASLLQPLLAARHRQLLLVWWWETFVAALPSRPPRRLV